MKMLPTIWTGHEGLEVYSEVHQTLGNIIIHTLFLPVITYSILRWIYLLTDGYISLHSLRRIISTTIVTCIFLFYANFYVKLGYLAVTVWMGLTVPLILLANSDNRVINTKKRAFLCFIVPLLLQEIVGHTLFEGANSRLTISHIINAILYTPVFYTHNLWRFVSILLGYPWLHTDYIVAVFAGASITMWGFYMSLLFFI